MKTQLKNELFKFNPRITAKDYMNFFEISFKTAQNWLAYDKKTINKQRILLYDFFKIYGVIPNQFYYCVNMGNN